MMHTNPPQLPRKLINQLLHLAQLSPEHEICGLIGLQPLHTYHCYPITNTAKQSQHQFLLDSSEHIAAMKTMREQNETLFAIYHSHPHAAAIPSLSDIQLAAYPDALYLIISLNTKGILVLRGYRINQQHAIEIPLELTEY
ncbi:MAG: M67 family metallopeptidase [Methylovulum sp.]|jgi:proteasome lid subunit RPN8/RPN11